MPATFNVCINKVPNTMNNLYLIIIDCIFSSCVGKDLVIVILTTGLSHHQWHNAYIILNYNVKSNIIIYFRDVCSKLATKY